MFKVDLTASIDELEQGLLAREQAISLVRQQQAEMLRALDVMQVDRVDGARSLQEWARGRLRNRHRRISRRSERDVFVDRYVYLHDSFDGSRGRVQGELPGFEYRILAKALEERADMFGDLPGPRVAKPQRLADALVSIAQDSLELPTPEGETSHRTDPVAAVFVDAELADSSQGEAGAEIEFGPRVGPCVLDRILCSGRVQLVGLSSGKPVATSNGTRAIPPALRRFVAWRDGGCTIDGCHSRYRLQPHHIQPRANCGDHDPANLTTLCWFHHHVVAHGLGLWLDLNTHPSEGASSATTPAVPIRHSHHPRIAAEVAQDAFVADIDGGIGYRLGVNEAGDWSFFVAAD